MPLCTRVHICAHTDTHGLSAEWHKWGGFEGLSSRREGLLIEENLRIFPCSYPGLRGKEEGRWSGALLVPWARQGNFQSGSTWAIGTRGPTSPEENEARRRETQLWAAFLCTVFCWFLHCLDWEEEKLNRNQSLRDSKLHGYLMTSVWKKL